MRAAIKGVEYALPNRMVTNADLVAEFPEWTIEKIEEKTGIRQRPVTERDECSSDLGVAAAQRLFDSGVISPEEVDYLLFCTQSPDYFLPTTACIIQDRLGIPKSSGALDFNLGCSGYVYGLGVAKGLIETGQASNVLLITAETYSKFIHPGDKSVRTLFGDAGAATLIQGTDPPQEFIGPFVYGTDGKGAKNLIVPQGGLRSPMGRVPAEVITDEHGNQRSTENLYMNGSEIFAFTLLTVPKSVSALLAKSGVEREDVDLYIFHQANKFMLDSLRKKVKVPEEKFFVAYEKFGNTVSCTIPIALKEAQNCGALKPGMTVMLVGFGVGYSWGATLIRWV